MVRGFVGGRYSGQLAVGGQFMWVVMSGRCFKWEEFDR